MEGKLSVMLGIIAGGVTNALTGSIITTIAVALLSGGAAWLGQQGTKYLYYKIKNALKK